MHVADTSALYAVLNEADAHHRQAQEFLALGEPVVVPTEILTEFAGLVLHRKGPKAARLACSDLLGLQNVRVAEAVRWEGAWSVYARHPRLSLADAFVLQTCRVFAATPWTYDKALLRAWRA